MYKKLYTINFSYLLCWGILLIISIINNCVYSQDVDSSLTSTYISLHQDTISSDLVASVSDTASSDSLTTESARNPKKISKNGLEHTVTYDAKDSIHFSIKNKVAYLFNDAYVLYEDMSLFAYYIEIDFANNELYASGAIDENGRLVGSPVLKQGDGVFRAQEIKYNFETKKGKITHVITEEGDGYIHGEQIKKLEDNTTYIKKGKYTTCELDHPHFEISFTKAKVLPNDKIIMGPAYVSFADVPTPIAIPFGYFPLEKGRHSGLVMPTFGETQSLGFYLQNLGYYFGISDNFDLLIAGDIYTRGSWAVKAESNYVFRYKCAGKIRAEYGQKYIGEKLIDSTYYHTNDFKIYWDHKQDMKSHPYTRFNAHVDIVSSGYNKHTLSSINDYLSNQYSSSINFSTSAKGIFYLDAAISYSQNTSTRMVDIKLPTLNMSVTQFYPFRKKNKTGALKWYDNISMKWSSELCSQINTIDTLFFKTETWQNIGIGMRHNIPLTIPIKIAKLVNWNTLVNFSEKWYLQRYDKEFVTDTVNGTIYGSTKDVFRRGFYALHELSLSTELTTKVYVMYQFKKGKLKAIRHVITPNLNVTYRPKFNKNIDGEYFNTVTGEYVKYSYFSNSIYGSVNGQTQALAQLSFNNNIEIKVHSRKDTITGTKKIAIFDNLSISMGYDFAADSLRWQPLRISGRSTLWKQLNITFSLSFDPYIINENGVRANQTEWKVNKRLLRFSNANINVGLNLVINKDLFKGKQKNDKKNSEQTKNSESIMDQNLLGMPNTRPDFNNPWSLTINYTFAYTTSDNYGYYLLTYRGNVVEKPYQHKFVQTLNIIGEFNITKKWKVGFTTGYDFVQKEMSYTSIDIYRDLHCWEMRFNWIPFGYRKGWSFTINIKAAALQDVKLNLKKDFRDNMY
ncbi:MAG: LPS-assembly protein LptD [Bacteroidales bacterium]|nr:LPS-assembly protein LptD [Bacteroidales bacterium]